MRLAGGTWVTYLRYLRASAGQNGQKQLSRIDHLDWVQLIYFQICAREFVRALVYGFYNNDMQSEVDALKT